MSTFLAGHRMFRGLTLTACLVALSGCGPGHLERFNLPGTWKAVSVKMEGEPAEGRVARTITLTFSTPNKITFVTDGEVHRGVCEVDTSTDPKRIIIRPADGNIVDRPLFGIFTVEGDNLVLCVSQRRTPPAFLTKKGYDYVLIEFKRKGQEPSEK